MFNQAAWCCSITVHMNHASPTQLEICLCFFMPSFLHIHFVLKHYLGKYVIYLIFKFDIIILVKKYRLLRIVFNRRNRWY